jgi:hypothetical protein
MAGSKMPRTSPKSSSDYPTPDQEILMAELQQIPYAWACYAEDGSILQYANIFAVFPTRKLALEECRENKNAYKPVKVKIVPQFIRPRRHSAPSAESDESANNGNGEPT